MDAINDGNGLCTEVGLSVMGNFLMRCLPVRDLGLAAGAVHPGMDRTSEARINCKLCHVVYYSLSPPADGPRPDQKDIISLRALILLFLKLLILKVHPGFMAGTA